MSASSSRTILVTGATGKQGGAVLSSLLAHNETCKSPYSLFVVTRDASSARAQKLASQPNVTVVEGDLTRPSSFFTKVSQPIWGVFGMTNNGEHEEAEGKSLVDAAVEAKVQHFVLTSGNRGKDSSDPTPVAHFASKFFIELYLYARAKESNFTWTVLQPVTFYDNYTNDFAGKGFAAMWRQLGDKKLKLVATEDMGFWAAKAFVEAEGWGKNHVQPVAGDCLTFEQARQIYQRNTGKDMPVAPCVVGSVAKLMMHDIGVMFKWLAKEGYSADVEECRRVNPTQKDWATWLRESSTFKGEIKT